MFHHHTQEFDDDLRAWANQNLAFSSPLSIHHAYQTIIQNTHAYHYERWIADDGSNACKKRKDKPKEPDKYSKTDPTIPKGKNCPHSPFYFGIERLWYRSLIATYCSITFN